MENKYLYSITVSPAKVRVQRVPIVKETPSLILVRGLYRKQFAKRSIGLVENESIEPMMPFYVCRVLDEKEIKQKIAELQTRMENLLLGTKLRIQGAIEKANEVKTPEFYEYDELEDKHDLGELP